MSSVSTFLAKPYTHPSQLGGRYVTEKTSGVKGWIVGHSFSSALGGYVFHVSATKDPQARHDWVIPESALELIAEPSFIPPPTEVEEAVCEAIRARRDAGRKKYGTTMERTDLTAPQWLQHAQEEAMDFAIYLEKLRCVLGEQEQELARLRAENEQLRQNQTKNNNGN